MAEWTMKLRADKTTVRTMISEVLHIIIIIDEDRS